MNTGQTILSAGAMMLLAILVLRMSNVTIQTQDHMHNSKFGILAVSIASSLLEQATQKAFDESTKENFVTSLTSLTERYNFGCGLESGEFCDSLDSFDDYDDFHNYTNVDSTMPSAFFEIHCTVDYVNPNVTGFISSNRTWHKMMTVRVSSPSMKDTVVLRKVFSYWKLP